MNMSIRGGFLRKLSGEYEKRLLAVTPTDSALILEIKKYMTLRFILEISHMIDKKIKILVSLIILFLLFVSMIWIFNLYTPLNELIGQINNDDGFNPGEDTPVLTVDIDRYNKTITVISVEKGIDLLWSNVEIRNGTAILPEGSIDVGDVITDCIGFLDFVWKPTMTVFLHGEFVRTGL